MHVVKALNNCTKMFAKLVQYNGVELNENNYKK